MTYLLIASDLDRTLIPNGSAIENKGVRDIFCSFISRVPAKLVYISGRSFDLINDAIVEYNLPEPHYMIADVGTTLFAKKSNKWLLDSAWQDVLNQKWKGQKYVLNALDSIKEIRPQESIYHNMFKISFYADIGISSKSLIEKIEKKLKKESIRATIIYSVDEILNVALIDILPENASKYKALQFLIEHEKFKRRDTVFSGDSGNDLSILTSDIPSTLVANASEEVKRQAKEKANPMNALYLADGKFGMNGNYAAGVIEGILYYHPQFRSELEASVK